MDGTANKHRGTMLRRFFQLVLFSLPLAGSGPGQARPGHTPPPVPLIPPAVLATAGSQVQLDLVQDTSVAVEIPQPAGTLLQLEIVQDNPDARIQMTDPAGTVCYDVETGEIYRLVLSLVAPQSGRSRLLIYRHPLTQREECPCRVTVEILKPAGDDDVIRARTIQQAWRDFSKAEESRRQAAPEGLPAVAEFFSRVRHSFRCQNQPDGEIAAGIRLGTCRRMANEREKALTVFKELLPLLTGPMMSSARGAVLLQLAGIHAVAGEFQAAREYLQEALPLLQHPANLRLRASALISLGGLQALSDPARGEQLLEEGRILWRDMGYHDAEAMALSLLCVIRSTLGRKDDAANCYKELDALRKSNGSKDTLARDTLAARKKMEEGARLCAEENPEARRQAIVCLDEAARRWEEAGVPVLRAICLAGAGSLLLENGRPEESLGRIEEACNYANQHLTGPYRELLELMRGKSLLSLNRLAEARPALQQSLESGIKNGDRIQEMVARIELARLNMLAGELAAAQEQAEQALRMSDTMRNSLAAPLARIMFNVNRRAFHELYVDLLVRRHEQEPDRGFDNLAWQASDRFRAMALLESMREVQSGMNPCLEPDLAERERSLLMRIGQADLARSPLINTGLAAAKLAGETPNLDELLDQYRQLQGEIRRRNPSGVNVLLPEPVSLAGLRQSLLDGRSQLLEYFLGEEGSYLWIVSREKTRTIKLPARKIIEDAARRWYELMTVPARPVPGETPARRQQRLQVLETETVAAGREVGRLILAPAAPLLTAERWLIVADGALQYLPFAALPDPGGHPSAEAGPAAEPSGTPVLAAREVVMLPSAASGLLLASRTAKPVTDGLELVILADPVFELSDPRLAAAVPSRPPAPQKEEPADAPPEPSTGSLISGLRDEEAATVMSRLPFSRREASAIARLQPESKRLVALDFQACKAIACGTDAGKARIVHFATHGRLDTARPELSGLVLSLVGADGRPQDGFLRSLELYRQHWAAELVVLSGCQTALGKEMRSEGLLGLTAGFMQAGARQVLASLWKVDDAATASLMTWFYDGLLKERLSPAAALRRAQNIMRRDKRWRSPVFWGAFILQGV